MEAFNELPEGAESPSVFETVLFCIGLNAMLQARTVDFERNREPAECAEAGHEDLLAPWPKENHDNMRRLSREEIKLGIVRQAAEDLRVRGRDTREHYDFLYPYRQQYLPLTGADHPFDLPHIWNQSLKSQQGLVPDLVAAVSNIPAKMMLLPVRIKMGGSNRAAFWNKEPLVKTVLLVNMRQRDWLPKEQSLKLAYKCKAILVSHGISGVEVEVRAIPSSSWECRSSAAEPIKHISDSGDDEKVPSSRPLRELGRKRHEWLSRNTGQQALLRREVQNGAKQALLSADLESILTGIGTLGLEVSPSRSRASRGTLGPILRLLPHGDDPEMMVGLTCNHVVERTVNENRWPPLAEPFVAQPLCHSSQSNDVPQDMYLTHESRLERIRNDLGESIHSMKRALKMNVKAAVHKKEDSPDSTKVDHENATKRTEIVEDLQAILDAVPTKLPSLGPVIAASAFGKIVEVRDSIDQEKQILFSGDWALIGLDPWILPAAQTDNEPSDGPCTRSLNRLRTDRWHLMRNARHYGIDGDPDYWRPLFGDREHKAYRFTEVSGLADPPEPHISHRVFKQGAATGFTYGKTMGALAVLPRVRLAGASPEADHDEKSTKSPAEEVQYTTELAVLVDKFDKPFSQPDDSGSAVINKDGEVVGMLVREVAPCDPESKMSRAEGQRRVMVRLNELVEGSGDEYPHWWLLGLVEENGKQDLTFVTPIGPILEDIRRVTGRTAEIA